MRRGRGTLRERAWHAPLAVLISCTLVISGAEAAFGAPPASATGHPAPTPPRAPAAQHVKPVVPYFAGKPADPAPYRAKKAVWPTAVTATVPLTGKTRVASGPVWAQPVARGPSSVRVKVLDHAAASADGVDGVLLSVSAGQSGPVRVGVDYEGFAQAYGGDYGSRLRLVSYPSCVLTTPTAVACHTPTPLPSANDAATSTVSAKMTVAAAPTVVAAVSAPGGSGGGYAPTSLNASGTWSGGGSAGSFTYTYPIAAAPAVSPLVPTLNLAYDSSVSDGETAATSAQASWVGEGWNTRDTFIEQSFQSCSESPEGSAAPTKTYDQCYDGPIYTLSLNGAVTALVWDSGRKVFKTQLADGSTVRHICTKTDDATCVSGTGNGSDAYDQDWWQVVSRDGTTYSLGMNHLPGWASGKATTHSVATQPVYSAHSGDPCYDSAGMSSSVCTMSWRWGLDYVVDVHGNAMSYYYDQDTNYYGRFNGAGNVSYVRDTHLDHIDYGFRDGNAYATAPDRVLFTTSQRCVSDGCGPLSKANAPKWPDVPFDLVCASGATCTSHSPSYFSTVRLTGIQSQQYSASSKTYATVDSYALTQTEPAAGDGTAATLWLSQIVHTGSGGTGAAIILPPVSFTPLQLVNRVDTTHDGLPGFYKFRIGIITTETGSQINVSYELPNPCAAPVKTAPSSNTSSCYPVFWTPTGYTDPIIDWFNKWAVEKVVQTDPTGGASAQATSYQYKGGAAWHFDDNELVKAKYRTYGQFRGYGDVMTSLGDGANDARSNTESTYYRGMAKDLTDSQGGVHADPDQLAGSVLETSAYLGDDVDHSTITSYWVSAAAAGRSRTGLPALTSNLSEPVETFTRQALTSTGTTTWRYTATDTSFVSDPADSDFGLPIYAYTHTVPAVAAYDSCTSTGYASANTGKNLVGLVSATETDAVACGGYTAGPKRSVPGSVNTLTAPASVSRPAQVISATRNYYDDPAYSTTFPQTRTPTAGDVTMVRKAADYTGGAFVWQTLSRSAYDSIGRITDVYNGKGNDTRTTYTDDSADLNIGYTVTNALSQTTATTLDPQRGLTLTTTDKNAVVTTQQYDALGRVAAIWLNSRNTSTPANYLYTYALANNGPTAVTTKKLNETLGYQTSTLIYDGLLRARQTQTMTPMGGRLINDNFYDSRGWTTATYTGWWDQATLPNTTLIYAADEHKAFPMEDAYSYNSLGQVVIDQNEKNGVEVSRTTTAYNGDRTTVIAPTGGTIKSTLTDPLGRAAELDTYLTTPTVTMPADVFTSPVRVSGGTTSAVTYGYDQHGNQNSTVQGAGSGAPTWTQTFNLLGQITTQTDPDAGTSTGAKYDADGQILQSTDARGRTVSYTYDALDRKTGAYASAADAQQLGASGNQFAAWVYDNSTAVDGVTHAVGRLTATTAYRDGQAYTTQQTNFDIFGNSLGTTVTIPAGEGALAGAYTITHKYTPTTGLLSKDIYNQQGGLPAETVNHGYQGVFDLADRLGGLNGYADTTTYDAFGRINQVALGSSPGRSFITNAYDENNGRLTDQLVTRQTGAVGKVDEQAYKYDPAGNLTRQTSSRLGSASNGETQCFQYDGQDQLVNAWTANDACARTPGSGNSSMVADALGAGSAYWTTWTFDALGDRKTQVQHGATDTTTNYAYGSAAGTQPHTLTSTSTTGGASTSYAYDAAGNMLTRNNQALTFNDAEQLLTVGDSSFVYDADGGTLIERDPGTTTLYLGSEQFVLTTGTGAVTGTRYYTLPGGAQAVRTSTAVTFAVPDQHGTPSLYLDFTAQSPTWRQYTPYGDSRGPAVATPDNHGFLNQPVDGATGLTIVGARQYDPGTGRFITVDPVLERTDPTQLNGYAYAGNNPVGRSDASGLIAKGDAGSGCRGTWHPESYICNWDSTATWKDPTGISSVFDGISNAAEEMAKGVGKVTKDAAMCKAHLGCDGLKQDGRAVGQQAVNLNQCHSGDMASCKKLMASFGCAKFDGNCIGHIIFFAATAMLSDGVGDLVAGGGDALAVTTDGASVTTDAATAAGKTAVDGGKASKAVSSVESCVNSFTPDTGVLMADGSVRAISEVKVGDEVVATDAGSGKTTAEPVTLLHDNLDRDFVDLVVGAAGHTSTIHTTEHHPFWDASTGKWTDAGGLKAGDRLRSTTGTTVVVRRVHAFTGAHRMLNLTVDRLHTYYVMAGQESVLVHNTCPILGAGAPKAGNIAVVGRLPDTSLAKGWAGHDVLDIPDWTIAKNDEWINQVVANRQEVYIVSRVSFDNLWDRVEGRPTVMSREIGMLEDAGYTWDGESDFMHPPAR